MCCLGLYLLLAINSKNNFAHYFYLNFFLIVSFCTFRGKSSLFKKTYYKSRIEGKADSALTFVFAPNNIICLVILHFFVSKLCSLMKTVWKLIGYFQFSVFSKTMISCLNAWNFSFTIIFVYKLRLINSFKINEDNLKFCKQTLRKNCFCSCLFLIINTKLVKNDIEKKIIVWHSYKIIFV